MKAPLRNRGTTTRHSRSNATKQETVAPELPFTMTITYRDVELHPFGKITQASEVHSWGATPTYRNLLIGGLYSLVYVYEGGGAFVRSDGYEQKISAGDMILTFPQFQHSYGGGNQPWKEFSIRFEGSVFDDWQKMGVLNPNKPIWRLEPIEYWHRRFTEIVAHPQWPGPSSVLTRCTHLMYVLADAFRHEDLEANGLESQRWLQSVCEQIDGMAHGGTLNWAKIAAFVKMTPDGFRRRFTRLARMTPASYHRQSTMQQVGQMLHDPNLTMSEIAEAMGFCNQFHFSHQFKKMMGVSPTDFRKRLFGQQNLPI